MVGPPGAMGSAHCGLVSSLMARADMSHLGVWGGGAEVQDRGSAFNKSKQGPAPGGQVGAQRARLWRLGALEGDCQQRHALCFMQDKAVRAVRAPARACHRARRSLEGVGPVDAVPACTVGPAERREQRLGRQRRLRQSQNNCHVLALPYRTGSSKK